MQDDVYENAEDMGLPDEDHIDVMMQAAMDTVEGTEGMSLTEAQQYAVAVLATNGVRMNERHGNEGFMDSVKAGFKKIWDYIVKMFKAIWGFFFKTKNKEGEAKVTLALQNASEAVETVNSMPASAPRTSTVKQAGNKTIPAKDMAKKLSKSLGSIPETSESKALKEELDDETKPVPIKDTVTYLMKNKIMGKFTALADSMEKHIPVLEKIDKDGIDLKAADCYGADAENMHRGLKAYADALRKAQDTSGLQGLVNHGKRLASNINSDLTKLSRNENKVKQKMASIESTGSKNPEDKELQGMMTSLKNDLSLAVRVIKSFESIRDELSRDLNVLTGFMKEIIGEK